MSLCYACGGHGRECDVCGAWAPRGNFCEGCDRDYCDEHAMGHDCENEAAAVLPAREGK